jgi:pimeloyl-ACP methyl ester carboxylesterase
VERTGHGGSPIVLVHGFGTCTFLWRTVAPLLATARHTAVAVDLLGHGESDRPIEADFGVAAQAEYLDRALTALRIARALVVGVDVGGGVALRLAATRPDRVSGLVLVNPVALDALPGRDVRTLQRSTGRFALRLSRGMFGARTLLAPVLEGSVADPTRMPERLVARYLAPFVGVDGASHLLDLARSLRQDEVEEIDLSSIAAPTLVVWGEADRWLDAGLPERIVGALPGARLVRLPNLGRLVPEEDPERLSALIAQHAASVDAREHAREHARELTRELQARGGADPTGRAPAGGFAAAPAASAAAASAALAGEPEGSDARAALLAGDLRR